MRAIIQRVLRGCVRVNGETISSIERGFIVLVGITDDDTTKDAEWMYIAHLHASGAIYHSSSMSPTYSYSVRLQMSQNLGRAFVGRRHRQGVEHERHADGLRSPPWYVARTASSLRRANPTALSPYEQSASSLFMATSRVHSFSFLGQLRTIIHRHSPPPLFV